MRSAHKEHESIYYASIRSKGASQAIRREQRLFQCNRASANRTNRVSWAAMYWMGQRHGPLHPVAKLVTYRSWLTATHGGLEVTDAAPIRLELKWGPLVS